MFGPSGSTPTVHPNEEEMLNGNGTRGDGSRQIIPTAVQLGRVEENRTLVPYSALEIVPKILAQPI